MFRLNLPGWGKNFTDTMQQNEDFSQEEPPVAQEGTGLQEQFIERVLDIAKEMADELGLSPGEEVVISMEAIPTPPGETPLTPAELNDGFAMKSSDKGLMHLPTADEESERFQVLTRNKTTEI